MTTSAVDYPAQISAWAREVLRRQHDALDTACWDALRDGCEVHVYPHPPDRISLALGIELRPGPCRVIWHPPSPLRGTSWSTA